jgi:hypothetical protein
MKSIFISLTFICLFFATSVNAQDYFISDDQEYAKPDDNGFYGEPFDVEAGDMSWKEIDKNIRKFEGSEGNIRGTVAEICQAKGCWLSLESDGQTYMVKFKDYGFFLPRDISGKEVVLHGTAYIETTTVDELRHYAEDAGKSADEISAITEPKKELKFMADGAVVLP